MADRIYNLLDRMDTDCSENDFLVPEFFFVRLLSFGDMVDFDVCDLMYAKA